MVDHIKLRETVKSDSKTDQKITELIIFDCPSTDMMQAYKIHVSVSLKDTITLGNVDATARDEHKTLKLFS